MSAPFHAGTVCVTSAFLRQPVEAFSPPSGTDCVVGRWDGPRLLGGTFHCDETVPREAQPASSPLPTLDSYVERGWASPKGVVHRARPRAPPLVLMCWTMSHYILEQVGTARGALGRARCTTPQFGPLGGPVSRPERANFEATVRGRKCGSRKDHYSPG